jgi:hypothetical protein
VLSITPKNSLSRRERRLRRLASITLRQNNSVLLTVMALSHHHIDSKKLSSGLKCFSLALLSPPGTFVPVTLQSMARPRGDGQIPQTEP